MGEVTATVCANYYRSMFRTMELPKAPGISISDRKKTNNFKKIVYLQW